MLRNSEEKDGWYKSHSSLSALDAGTRIKAVLVHFSFTMAYSGVPAFHRVSHCITLTILVHTMLVDVHLGTRIVAVWLLERPNRWMSEVLVESIVVI